MATPRHRIAGVAVDAGLAIVTLGIGFFIWSMIVWNQGQTPGKSLLKLRVLDAESRTSVNWGRMLIRQSLIPGAINIFWYLPDLIISTTGNYASTLLEKVCLILCIVISLIIWIIDFVWLFINDNRRLVDYWANTIVVNEAN